MAAYRKILLGLVLGAGAGVACNLWGADVPWVRFLSENIMQPLGQIFIRLLFMLVVPLLFSAVVVGICGLDLRAIGRLGARTLVYTVVVSTISVLIGLTLVNVLQPGRGVPESVRQQVHAADVKVAPPGASGPTLIVALVPDNPVKAAANGDLVGILLFAIFFGIALARTRTPATERLREVIEGLNEVTMKLIDGVLMLAPVGVAALLFTLTSRMGAGIVQQVLAYVLVAVLGLALHMFGVYSLSVKFLGGRSPREFFRGARLAMITAFSTASSSATLPTALKVAEQELKLPPHVTRFVLTAGSAMNQNGTALFEGVTVLFLAQVYGVEMGLARQAVVMGICVLAGIGTAGVPTGSMPVLAMILGIFGIPAEGLGLILGVDRFLDMCRTTVNVTGDLAAAVYVARDEESLPPGDGVLPIPRT
ncbi:MAG: dicarboxylate/amino acid:cation symporter [Myxococcota bacterium]